MDGPARSGPSGDNDALDGRHHTRREDRRCAAAGDVGRRRFLASTAVWGSIAVAGCVERPWREEVSETWTEQYDPPGGGQVTVENLEGSVSVRGADRGTIELSVEKRAAEAAALDQVRVRAGPEDNEFVVETDQIGDPGDLPVTVDIVVTVPRTYPVVRAGTKNGNVSVEGVQGDLCARCVNGDVDVDGVRGYVTAEAGNGDLSVTRTTGIEELAVSNGSVDADVRAIRSDSRIETTNGDVDARLGPGLDAVVRAEATSGSVAVDGVPLENATIAPRMATGTLGDGTNELTVVTANGVVTLSPL